jgi:hypothetical protein
VSRLTTDATIVAAHKRQLSTTLAGEVVILDVDRGEYFGLDGVGTVVWHMLQTPCRLADLVDRIVSEYDVSRETAEEDLHGLLADLAARGLIEIDGAPPR